MIYLVADALRDSIWQFIGVIIGFLALVVAGLFGYLTYRISQRRKALTYEVLSITSLAKLEEDVQGRLKILFDEHPVRDVKLALIRITNSGNQPIGSQDFERSIRLTVNDKARILSAGVTRQVPENLGATIEYDNSTVTLNPLLMNNGDSVTINVLSTELQSDVVIDGRIVGVKEIEKGQRRTPTFQFFQRGFIAIPLVATIIVLVVNLPLFRKPIGFNTEQPSQEQLLTAKKEAEDRREADIEEIKRLVKDSQEYEVRIIYSNPGGFIAANLEKYWIPSNEGGFAAKEIENTIQLIKSRSLQYYPDAKNERFDFTDIQFLPSTDIVVVSTSEQWYLPYRRGPFIFTGSSWRVGPYTGLYVVKKWNDKWLVQQESSLISIIRYRG